MKENIYKYIYRTAMGILVVSAVLLFFVSSSAPFGMVASWSTDKLGSSLVFSRPDATASLGQRVAGATEIEGKVVLFTIEEVLRREGVMYYRVSDPRNSGEIATVPASDFGRSVVFSLPFIGFVAQMLNDFLGVMTLIGLPLMMLLINYAQRTLQKALPVVSVLEKSIQRETKEKRKEMLVHRKREREEVETEEEDRKEYETEYVTVLKPYNFRRTYSH